MHNGFRMASGGDRIKKMTPKEPNSLYKPPDSGLRIHFIARYRGVQTLV